MGGEGRLVVMLIYGGGSVGVLMRFVWRSLALGMCVEVICCGYGCVRMGVWCVAAWVCE